MADTNGIIVWDATDGRIPDGVPDYKHPYRVLPESLHPYNQHLIIVDTFSSDPGQAGDFQSLLTAVRETAKKLSANMKAEHKCVAACCSRPGKDNRNPPAACLLQLPGPLLEDVQWAGEHTLEDIARLVKQHGILFVSASQAYAALAEQQRYIERRCPTVTWWPGRNVRNIVPSQVRSALMLYGIGADTYKLPLHGIYACQWAYRDTLDAAQTRLAIADVRRSTLIMLYASAQTMVERALVHAVPRIAHEGRLALSPLSHDLRCRQKRAGVELLLRALVPSMHDDVLDTGVLHITHLVNAACLLGRIIRFSDRLAERSNDEAAIELRREVIPYLWRLRQILKGERYARSARTLAETVVAAGTANG